MALFQLFKLYVIIKNLHLLILAVIALNLIYKRYLLRNQIDDQTRTFSFRLKTSDVLLCLSISLVPVLIVRMHIPFGYFGFGWMIPTIINQPALRIIEHGYMTLAGRWPEYLLTALSCMIFNCEPMSFNWVLPFVLGPLYSIGLYLLSYRLFNNRAVSIFTALFGAFLNIGSSYQTFFFDQFIANPRSNTILYSIFPLTLFFVDKELSSRNYKAKDVALSLLTLVTALLILYFPLETAWFRATSLGLPVGFRVQIIKPAVMLFAPFMGFIVSKILRNDFAKANFQRLFLIALTFELFHETECLLFIATIILYVLLRQFIGARILLKLPAHKIKYSVSPMHLIVAFTFLFVFLQWIGYLNIYNTNPISSVINPAYKLPEPGNLFLGKRRWFEDANSPVILSLLIIGSTLMIFSKKQKELFLVTMLSLTLLIYFLPDFWTYRAYKEFSPFIALVLANSVYSIYKLTVSVSTQFGFGHIKKYVTLFYVSVMLVILIPNLVSPVCARFSFSPPGKQSYTLIADYEYETAEWLRKYTPENARIISDFRTIVLITPLANKLWLTSRSMSVGGLSEYDKGLVLYIKNNIFLASDSRSAYEATLNLSNQVHWIDEYFIESRDSSLSNELLIVISARTIKWIEQRDINDVFFPQYGSIDPNYLERFRPEYFRLLYNIDDEIYVLKVNVRT